MNLGAPGRLVGALPWLVGALLLLSVSLLPLVAPAHGAAMDRIVGAEGEGRQRVAEPTEALELSLMDAGSEAELAGDEEVLLTVALTEYFESCHPYDSVVLGKQPAQAHLRNLWREHARGAHAMLRESSVTERPHGSAQRLTVLFGFGAENEPPNVLVATEDGTLEAYIKCSGHLGLLLACRVHEILPARTPSPDCEHWREIGHAEAASRVTRAYAAAWRANDPEALRALLASDVVLMPSGLVPIEGAEAAMAFWFPDDGSTTRITAFDQDVDEAFVSGELAVVRSRSTISYTYEKDGEISEHTSHVMSLTVLRQEGSGQWLIARRMWGPRRD